MPKWNTGLKYVSVTAGACSIIIFSNSETVSKVQEICLTGNIDQFLCFGGDSNRECVVE